MGSENNEFLLLSPSLKPLQALLPNHFKEMFINVLLHCSKRASRILLSPGVLFQNVFNFMTSWNVKFICLDLKVLWPQQRCTVGKLQTGGFPLGTSQVGGQGRWLFQYLTLMPPIWHCSPAPSPPGVSLPQFHIQSSHDHWSPAWGFGGDSELRPCLPGVQSPAKPCRYSRILSNRQPSVPPPLLLPPNRMPCLSLCQIHLIHHRTGIFLGPRSQLSLSSLAFSTEWSLFQI